MRQWMSKLQEFCYMFSCNCSCRSQPHAWRVHKPIPEVKKSLPKGRGRKGGQPARKRQKLPTSETRVPLNPTSSHSEDPCCSFSYHGSITQPQAQVSLSSPPPMLPRALAPSGLPPLHVPCHSPQSVTPFASPGTLPIAVAILCLWLTISCIWFCHNLVHLILLLSVTVWSLS